VLLPPAPVDPPDAEPVVDAPDTEPVVDAFDPEALPDDRDDVESFDPVLPPSALSSPDLAGEVPQA
jgi:hypothetical protein